MGSRLDADYPADGGLIARRNTLTFVIELILIAGAGVDESTGKVMRSFVMMDNSMIYAPNVKLLLNFDKSQTN